jgi:hypothetical protein
LRDDENGTAVTVPTKNPNRFEVDPQPEPDQASWAKLSITVERSDGGIVDAEIIRPRSWILASGLCAGRMLPLNLPELEVSGLALVTAIDDCPPIADGEGSVVTARFVTREVHVVASVDVLGADGTVETITGTTIHPFWSVDRQEWVPLAELTDGETLQGLDGLAVVLSVTLSRVSQPVYNIEVHGEHVYQVGELGLVVHNAEGLICKTIGEAGELAAGTLGRKKGVASVLRPGTLRFPDKIDDTAKIIYETKNVAYQHLSTQLRDYVKIAEDMGYQLVLNIRKGTNTKVSSPLQQLFDQGIIIPNRIL